HSPPRLTLFTVPATTEIYTLSLHDALPICGPDAPFDRLRGAEAARGRRRRGGRPFRADVLRTAGVQQRRQAGCHRARTQARRRRSEEHTSELQSRENLVCRLLLEKKKKSAK